MFHILSEDRLIKVRINNSATAVKASIDLSPCTIEDIEAIMANYPEQATEEEFARLLARAKSSISALQHISQKATAGL